MLARFQHWRFATKLSPALQEKRLLRFASGSDDDENDDLEQTHEGAPEQQETPKAESDVDKLQEETRSEVEGIRPLVAYNLVTSPFLLTAGMAMLDQLPEKDEAIQYIVRKGDNLYEKMKKGEDTNALEKELAKEISELLTDSKYSVALTKAFEARMHHVHELKTEIGSSPMHSILEIEREYNPKGEDEEAQKKRAHFASMLTDTDAWSEEETEEICAKLHIPDTADEVGVPENADRETHSVFRWIQNIPGFGEKRTRTKEEKLRVAHGRIMAGRKIATLEKKDLGTETTLDGTEEMERMLFEQLLQARQNLEQNLERKAKQYSKHFKRLLETLHEKSGSNSTRDIATYLGISEEALLYEFADITSTIQYTLRKGKLMDGVTDDPENLPAVADEAGKFMSVAEKLQQKLGDLSWLESKDWETLRQKLTGFAVHEQKAAEAWAFTRKDRLRKALSALEKDPELKGQLLSLLNFGQETNVQEQLNRLALYADIGEKIAGSEATPDDLQIVYSDLTSSRRREFDMLILAAESPRFLQRLYSERKTAAGINIENTPANLEALRDELYASRDRLLGHSLLKHETCRALRIDEQLRDTTNGIEKDLKALPRMKGANAQVVIRNCKQEITKLSHAADELDALNNQTKDWSRIRNIRADNIGEYEKVARTTETPGCYNQSDGIIYLNESKIRNGKHRKKVIHHEKGHAIVDTLMHRTGVLPTLFIALNETLAQEVPGGNGKTYNELLISLEEAFHVDKLRDVIKEEELERANGNDALALQRTDARIQELMMDELVNKYATWVHEGKRTDGVPDANLKLFRLLDQDQTPLPVKFDTEDIKQKAPMALQMSDDDMLAAEDGKNGSAPSGEVASGNSKLATDILSAQNKFLRIREFIDAHQNTEGVEEFENWVNQWEKGFEETIKKPFYKNDGGNFVPEQQIQTNVDNLKNVFFEEVNKEMKKMRRQEMDASEGAQGDLGLWGAMRSVRFVSIMDVVKTFQSMGEDLQRMWKRRGESVQAQLGQNLTSWIGDNVPYAGQLKHEFQRRASASEVEEVNQWKEALKDDDSYSLMDILAESRNKDQIRAIAEILTERGRMDMNDERMWKTLKDLSGMNMPIEACKDDSVLRDKWLHKMVNAIWSDKDKFYEWRQANDSGIDSAKGKFTQLVDQLSNFRGELAATLERQLKMYAEGKRTGSMPEEVNPHLYEKILHYSMSNGKMSMEDKMFYLVQGARYGIISIDRIQALAGENGGVLNQFPMIDYFNGENNTIPEIKAIGARIEESGDPFKPGQKTSFWIHTEVLRDEDARQRMSKAMSGARTEALDHEDIPTLAAIMDYKTAEEITGVLSGARFKISYEAAKNFYTGTGKGLLIKARKAQLAQEKKARFTTQDAEEAARTIMTHIHFDNILTRNAQENGSVNRLSMTVDQLSTQTGPSTGGKVVKEFRDPLQHLAREALQKAGITFGSGKLKNISLDTYVRGDNDTSSIEDADRRKNNFDATEEVSRQLMNAFKNNPNMARDLLAELGKNLLAEGGDKIEKDELLAYIQSTQNHEQLRLVDPILHSRSQSEQVLAA